MIGVVSEGSNRGDASFEMGQSLGGFDEVRRLQSVAVTTQSVGHGEQSIFQVRIHVSLHCFLVSHMFGGGAGWTSKENVVE